MIIAMTNEPGAESKAIADRICARLGIIHVLHHNELHVFGQPLPRGESATCATVDGGIRSVEERQKLREALICEVLEIASHGKVLIRGTCAPAILRDVGQVLRVRVCAPMHVRARNAMASLEAKDEPAAAKQIRAADKNYADLIDECFNVDFTNPYLYDLVVNSGRLPVDDCVDLICSLAGCQAIQPSAASRVMLDVLLAEARGAVVQNSGGNEAPPSPIRHAGGTPEPGPALSFDEQIARAEQALFGDVTLCGRCAPVSVPRQQPVWARQCWD